MQLFIDGLLLNLDVSLQLNRSKCQQMLVKVQNQMASIRRDELLSAEKVKHSFAASQPNQLPRRGQKGFRNKKSPYAIAPFVATDPFKKSFEALARARFGPPSKPKETKSNKLVSLLLLLLACFSSTYLPIIPSS